MALIQGMLYREEKMILYNGNLNSSKQFKEEDYAGNDPFFSRNYDNKFISKFKQFKN